MMRAALFLLTLILSSVLMPKPALALAPEDYAELVLLKDLPRAVNWLDQVSNSNNKTQAEIYTIYQKALPETQANRQLGISTRGSIERMLLLLEGSRYFEQIQAAPASFQSKKDNVMRVLQGAKDQLDRAQFGEDPQVLLEEWVAAAAGFGDAAQFAAQTTEVFTELAQLLATPPIFVAVSERVDAEPLPEAPVDPGPAVAVDQSFERERFASYIQNAESGVIAEECQNAVEWKTDKSESCKSDDPAECDRTYARQCKKLQ